MSLASVDTFNESDDEGLELEEMRQRLAMQETKNGELSLLVTNLLEQLKSEEETKLSLFQTLAQSQQALQTASTHSSELCRMLQDSNQERLQNELTIAFMQTPQYLEQQTSILNLQEQMAQLQKIIEQKENDELDLTVRIEFAKATPHNEIQALTLIQEELASHRAEYQRKKDSLEELQEDLEVAKAQFFENHQEPMQQDFYSNQFITA
jgi:hypothetical protein